MARIPDGSQFGQVVARGGPMANIDPGAYGAETAQAVTRAGAIGMQGAQQSLNQDAAEAKHAEAQALAEQKQQARELEAEAKATAKEEKRTNTAVASATAKNGLKMLGLQLESDLDTGKIKPDELQSIWTEKSAKLIEDAGGGIDEQNRPLFNASLLDDVGSGQFAIEKIVINRNRKTILANGVAMQEQLQRAATSGPKEADKAISDFRSFWLSTASSAGEDAATATKRVQAFAETVRSNQATGLVNKDPGAALKALKNPDFLPELDPDKRSALIQSADAAVLRNQQRGALHAEALARAQTKAWEGLQSVYNAGKMPTPEYAATLAKTFKGTPYEGALQSMMADGPANAAFVVQPLQKQELALTALQNKMNSGGATPEEIKQYGKLEQIHKATLSDIKDDPYKAASERGVLVNLQPLSIDLKTLPQQLEQRGQQAGIVSQWAGKEVSLFRPDEADKVGGILQALPPKDRAGALSGLAKTMTPGQMIAFGKQLGAKDDTLAAAALMAANGFKTSNGRHVSEIALSGADAMKEDRVKFPVDTSKTSVRAEIDKATRGAFLSEDAQRAAGDAALAVYAGLVAEGTTPDIKQVVGLATGGVMELNGAKIIKPYGWDDARVKDALKTIDATKINSFAGGQPAMVGGQPVTAEELAKHMPNATLGPSPRSGSYTVTIGGRLVARADGRPLLVPLGGK